jgi:hypothetical protein
MLADLNMVNPESKAAAIFSQGPETLVESSHAIVVGVPERLVKHVDQQSGGAEPIPVRWTLSGDLEHRAWLKGAPAREARSLSFRRTEIALFALMNSSTPDWELELGSVEQAAAVVLFFATKDLTDPKVLPSPKEGPDFVQLVKDIVRIESVAEPGRLQDWTGYASAAPSVEGRKAALRKMAASRAPWTLLESTWLQQIRDPASPAGLRTYAFLLMVHCVTQQCWPGSQDHLVAIALATFAGERDPSLALGYADGLLNLYDGADREPWRLPGVAKAVADVMQKRETLGPPQDEDAKSLNETYQQLREQVISPSNGEQ